MTPRLWMTFTLPVGIMLVAVACGESTEGDPVSVPTEVPSMVPALDSQEAEALRQLAFAYWDAFNAYDADKTLSFMEESYRLQQQEEVTNEIGLIELFGVKLEVSENTAPEAVGEGEREMYLNLREPLGTRLIRMAFRNVDGEWKIIYAEEQN